MTNSVRAAIDLRAKPTARWLLGSLVLHGCLLMFLFQPVDAKRDVQPESKPESVTSSARLEELSEKTRELQQRQMEEKVASLEVTLAAMEELEAQKSERLREAHPELTETAEEDAEAETANALAAQQRALASIEAAMSASDVDDLERLSEARLAAIEEQILAEQALARSATAQSLADRPTDAVEKVIELQTIASQILATARTKDLESKQAFAESQRRENMVAKSRSSIDQREAEVERQKSELAQKQAELTAAQNALAAAEKKIDSTAAAVEQAELAKQEAVEARQQSEAAVEQARHKFAAAQQTRDKDKIAAAQENLLSSLQAKNDRLGSFNQSQHELQNQQQQARLAAMALSQENKKVTMAQQKIASAQTRIDKSQSALASAEERASPLESAIEEQLKLANNSEAESKSQLAEARRAQERALAASLALDLATDTSTEATEQSANTTQATFERAGELERLVAQRFKDIRAADMSLVHQIDPSEARQLVGMALPERAPLDKSALDQPARTKSEFQHHLDTLTQANQQAQAMDEFAKSLLAKAQGLEHEALQITLADRQTTAAEEQRQSAEDHGGAVADMTSLMAQRSGQQKKDNVQEQGVDSLPEGNKDEKGDFTRSTVAAISAPPIPRDMARTTPARRFSTQGGTATKGWTFVDSWYLLGPFDNANRVNIHQQFPPESLIDLDANYRTQASPDAFGWKFLQSTEPQIQPSNYQGEYVIYYAWTELYFETATDAWIAVGSDDRSDLWINNVRVWSSSDELKMWRIDEGQRRVRFEAGMNKVLYRIENGHGPWSFSLCLNLDTLTPR